jgi:cell wall-associated NlpC family hydrolase
MRGPWYTARVIRRARPRVLVLILLVVSLAGPCGQVAAVAGVEVVGPIPVAPAAAASDAERDSSAHPGEPARRDLSSALVDYALQLIGVPYKLGGNDPDTGLDCSGLVDYVFAQVADIVLPRTVLAMSRVGERVARSRLRPGDLVFFHTRRSRYSHVGIYIGDGHFVHAPSPGSTVEVSELSDRYWRRHFSGARRVIPSDRLAAR